MDDVVVGLASAVEALRAELTEAMARGAHSSMRFRLEPLELTVQAVVTKQADGKIGWSILGAGGKYESAVTQTLTLRLSPVWHGPDGAVVDDVTIADEGPGGDTFGAPR